MTRREQLLEQYEEALFALLMEENTSEWEEEARREMEALEADPAAQVSPEADRRSLETIRRTVSRKTYEKSRHRAGRPLLAAACLALAFLAGSLLGPGLVREGALGVLLTGIGVKQPQKPLELEPGWLPQGWSLVRNEATRDRAVLDYTDGAGGTLRLELCAPPVACTVAEALPQGAEEWLDIQGREAALAGTGDGCQLAWRTETDCRVGIEATGLSREDLLTLAGKLKYE